jgi:hypothetical protein
MKDVRCALVLLVPLALPAQSPVSAMKGDGSRITYGRPGVRGRLAVGLWAYPAPVDLDGDGAMDLIVSCAGRPYNGTYFFRNMGTSKEPLFAPAERWGQGRKEALTADFNGDGRIDLVVSGGYFSDVRRNKLNQFVPVPLRRNYHVGRDDQWRPVDWDRDGKIDLLVGVSDWRDYGWDDAFDEHGRWTRGPLHGYVYWHRNTGTNEAPEYAEPVRLPIDTYGSPAPNPVEWFRRGAWDLVVGEFLDTVRVLRNTGSSWEPAGDLARMDLCMIQPRVVDWHGDGRLSLLIGEEDGAISLAENEARAGEPPRLKPPRYLDQLDPYVKSGALARPVACDWNGDGKLDIIAGNSAGYIQYFENTGTPESPAFTDRGYLRAARQVIRRTAGENRSVQGPAEAKWGYSNPTAADWDLDGDLDILVNDIWGLVVWYQNVGTRTRPELAAVADVEVAWTGAPPKPDWVWWQPGPRQLVTQWRTTPEVVDWDGDGLPDLVMLNHQGYLSLFRRARRGGHLILLPPERIFLDPGGRFLNLAAGRAGRSGRRKIEIVDWDGDGLLDLITDGDEGPLLYKTSGTVARPVMTSQGPILRAPLSGHSPTPNAADWNGDGRLDLLIGAEDGFMYYYERSFIERTAESRREGQKTAAGW